MHSPSYRVEWKNQTLWAKSSEDLFLLYPKFPSGKLVREMEPLARVGREEVKVVCPFYGRQVLGIAYNYRDLLESQNRDLSEEPLVFYKGVDSACLPDEPISIGPSENVWVEVELAFLVSQTAYRVSLDEARNYISGCLISSDVTVQNLYGRDHHLAYSKARNRFAPLGAKVFDLEDCLDRRVTTTVDGKVTQSSNLRNRIWDDLKCLEMITRYITLYPGDVVLTGTPAGALDSRVSPGSVAVHEIEGLDVMTLRFE